jgi:hypothetical protein
VNTDWYEKLDPFGRDLLQRLGFDWIPGTMNPVTAALKQGAFVSQYGDMPGFGKAAVCKVAIVCQMAVYDRQGGPDGDRKPKGLRRQWYAWFKTRLAQPFSEQLAENGDLQEQKGFDGTIWAGRMSKLYGWFVDNKDVTYRELWVDDASRMMDQFYATLFKNFNVVVAVEKDSLKSDFIGAAKALGAKSLVSGKGKMSKAATEKLLREHFYWSETGDVFSSENPLIFLSITDWDMDGEGVISPTFAEQARRYTPHVLEARVGIRPGMVKRKEWGDKWYQVKTTNSGYVKWAERNGLFLLECAACGHKWPQAGIDTGGEFCPECYCATHFAIKIKSTPEGLQPHGFEVEALPTRAYYPMLVDALLEVLPFEIILKKLRDECTADAYQAAETIRDEILEENESYQKLLELHSKLAEIKEEFENKIHNQMRDLGDPHVEEWRDLQEDPVPEDYRDHLREYGGRSYADAWRPFDRNLRTEKLEEFLRENEKEVIEGFKKETLSW